MNFRISAVIDKMRFAPRQTLNLNVKPNNAEFAPQAQKTVKIQMAKAKSGLRKVFVQKPDEFVPAQTSEVETVPTRIKELSKVSKHKRVKKTVIRHKHTKQPKKTVIPFENDTQEILTPLMSKEEEQQWIDIALRNHNKKWDFKPREEHYGSEIKNGIMNRINHEKGYEKVTEAKTKAYFNEIKADERYKDHLYFYGYPSQERKPIIVNLNNKLLLSK